MRQALITKPGIIEYRQVEILEPAEGKVLIKVICMLYVLK